MAAPVTGRPVAAAATGPVAAAGAVAKGAASAAAPSEMSPGDKAAAEFAKINVKGLTGTLNKQDVHQTMELRQPEFDRCIATSRRSVRFVSGAMKFAFKVDGEGHIAEVKTSSSTVGHRGLERCIGDIVGSTQFPRPAGRATAEFSWGLTVEPSGDRTFAKGKSRSVSKVVRKQAKELFGSCELRRRRARFKVTAYFDTAGHLLSAGAVPTPQSAGEKLDCVLDEMSKWSFPKFKKATKVSFDIR